MTKLERQYKHIVESLMDRGKPLHIAERVAAAVVNKRRAKLARSGKGPRLVSRGGSRRQWYPGKPSKGPWRCLAHHKRFKTKSGWMSHLRSHKKRKSSKRRYR